MRPCNILVDERKEKGITLIEVMIIVCIIGILAAIAIPQFARLVDRSRVDEQRRSQGLPPLTEQQYDKMYPPGTDSLHDKPAYEVNNSDPNSSDHFHSYDKHEVICLAQEINGRLLVDVGSCHER